MIYLYAITQDLELDELGGLSGLGTAPLDAATVEGLTAVFNEVSSDVVRVDETTLWRHERVIEALMQRRPVLPVRFGTTFSDPGALSTALTDRRPALKASLEQVAGKVELGVRAIREGAHDDDPAASEATPATGRDYILNRVREHRRREAGAAEARRTLEPLHHELERLSTDARTRWSVSPETLLAAAYLVDEDRVEDFRSAVDRAEKKTRDVRIFCTGPWPPYNFVDFQADGGGGALGAFS
jgi:Gas vesicle synthesis protein GvpL/GvpF